jgi:hypothetical protein
MSLYVAVLCGMIVNVVERAVISIIRYAWAAVRPQVLCVTHPSTHSVVENAATIFRVILQAQNRHQV